jgi:hypothetical protein
VLPPRRGLVLRASGRLPVVADEAPDEQAPARGVPAE